MPPATRIIRPASAALTGVTAAQIARDVADAGAAPVVIDLSGITEWDSEGALAVIDLSERSADRVRVRGLAEATMAMLGLTAADLRDRHPAGLGPTPASPVGCAVTRLRATAVIRPSDEKVLAAELEPIVERLHPEVRIVVLDLGATPTLSPEAVEAVVFASGRTATWGMELLVVNLSSQAEAELRRAGLSAQTWLAPAPLP